MNKYAYIDHLYNYQYHYDIFRRIDSVFYFFREKHFSIKRCLKIIIIQLMFEKEKTVNKNGPFL